MDLAEKAQSPNSNTLLNLIMQSRFIAAQIDNLLERALPDGGFCTSIAGSHRPDATAWAVLALAAAGTKADRLKPARTRLTVDQLQDGRVSVSPKHPDVFWPTALAILAWHDAPEYHGPQSRASDFLIQTTGHHFQKKAHHPFAHDPAIRGWPWTAKTHSWIEPTALSLMALQASGYGEHDRAQEALRMLRDRQLPAGGWNYGNTKVFGQELRPMPENTGMALNALAERAPIESVQHSLDYLQTKVTNLQTPLALGWSLLGLGAWGEQTKQARELIIHCLKQQEKYGPYDTTLLSLLLVAFFAKDGLVRIFT